MAISNREYRGILEILDTCYSIPDKTAMFNAACQKFRALIGIYSAVFIPTDPKTGEFLFRSYQIFENSESAMIMFLNHYSPMDPFVIKGWLSKHVNDPVNNTDLQPKNDLLNSEFGADFLMRMANVFYVLGSAIASQGDIVGAFALHRQLRQGDFSQHEKEIVKTILPHMARAMRNMDLLEGIVTDKEHDGVIAIGEAGEVIYINDVARQALKGNPVETIPDPGLGAEPVFLRNGAGRQYRVRTMPMDRAGKGKLVFLERHPPEGKVFAKLESFDLSHREKEISSLVIGGLSNREIAERLFICEQTVKDHVSNIFEKLGVSKRGELTAKVMGIKPICG